MYCQSFLVRIVLFVYCGWYLLLDFSFYLDLFSVIVICSWTVVFTLHCFIRFPFIPELRYLSYLSIWIAIYSWTVVFTVSFYLDSYLFLNFVYISSFLSFVTVIYTWRFYIFIFYLTLSWLMTIYSWTFKFTLFYIYTMPFIVQLWLTGFIYSWTSIVILICEWPQKVISSVNNRQYNSHDISVQSYYSKAVIIYKD